MAKDDYDVILYRLLVYLYACKKREIMFDPDTFDAAVRKDVHSDPYFNDILEMAQSEGLIKGVLLKKAWGGDKLLLSNLSDIEITAAGIRYLKENSTMKRIGDRLKDAVDIIAKLAGILQLV